MASDVIVFHTATVAGVLAATVVVLAVGLLGTVVRRRRRNAQHARRVRVIRERARADGDPGVVGIPPNAVPTGEIPLVPRVAQRERTLLVGPPTIDGVTLRDWLIHHTHRDGVWADVVVQFYTRAAADPRVAAYFSEVDMARLQRHFLATLTVLTHVGLHGYTVGRMAAAHRGVANPAGDPITGQVWDVVVSTLVGVLLGYGVPPSAVEPLGALLGPLRAVIVVEP